MKGERLDGKGISTFSTDLQEAHEVENRLGETLVKQYSGRYETSQSMGSFPDWDVSYSSPVEGTITFEVKQDKMSWKTGNIAIEFQRTLKDGTVKPTCLSISKADAYAYFIQDRFYIINTDELKQKIKSKQELKIVHGAGEGNRASCYLIPVKEFKGWCTMMLKPNQ